MSDRLRRGQGSRPPDEGYRPGATLCSVRHGAAPISAVSPESLARGGRARYTVTVKEEEDGKAAAWTFAGMILVFKVVTSIIIFIMAPSAHTFIFLLVMQWYWLLLPIPLIAVPVLFW